MPTSPTGAGFASQKEALESPTDYSRARSDSQPEEAAASPSSQRRRSPITTSEQEDALQQAETGIEVASSNDYESDAGYETDSSDTGSVSLASSARAFIYENGRRYHSFRAGAYTFPNDDREQDREDLKHAMYLKLFNETLHFAPLNTAEELNVIDLGTGTGIWCVDFADLYPNSNVVGIDLSPIQPSWVPPNLKFYVDDVESEWLHPKNHFDFVHTRHTIQAFRNWPQLMSRAFRHLKPGGWLECQEIDHFPFSEDGTVGPSNPICQYWDHISEALLNLGLDLRLTSQLANIMRQAGFINVTERIFMAPIGPWPRNRALKEVGIYWRAVLVEGLEAIALGPFTRGLGWRKEEVEVFLAHVRKAYADKSTHSYMPFYVIYGQKPPGGCAD